MSDAPFVPLRPIPMKDRAGIIFLEYGELDVLDSAFVLVDKTGIRTQIPVGGLACIMLEPGTRVSHAAVILAARVGCLLVWVGEAGVRLYASGQPGGARADKLRTCAQQQTASLVDHLVGAAKQCERHVEAKRLGSLEVDDHVNLRDLLDGEIGGLFAFENAAGVDASLPVRLHRVAAVAQ